MPGLNAGLIVIAIAIAQTGPQKTNDATKQVSRIVSNLNILYTKIYSLIAANSK
jgi:hypothetical protein